ncbi:MaoC family dehydratase [Arthrobacter gengyunqii]|uniref:MaoC family dehydratase n=1 Tax=Arthrobacter gengyunqii TaxID=2886940 RepID=A0ABS8GJS8_9MICC|nr:MaoC family dehydratase [Arthrobacter gengyunqii]MCC3265503.1 MaoC family dehydratase [Arthrobacter gengyunqii]
MTVFASADEIKAALGQEVGPSRWFTLDQQRINDFGRLSEDEQWIHTDPERAASGPFGITVAHGYLTLSLVSPIVMEIFQVENLHSAINYGMNKVRFPAPVAAGSRVRGTAVIGACEPVGDALQIILTVSITAEDATRPACVAEFLMRVVADSPQPVP